MRRLPPDEESSLRWFWRDSAAQLGLRSALGPQQYRLTHELGPSTIDPSQVGEINLVAAMRLTRVTRALRAVGAQHELTLRLFYAVETVFPNALVAAIAPLGVMAGVMASTGALERWPRTHERGAAWGLDALRLAVAKKKPGAAAAMTKVRIEADELLASACAAYAEAVAARAA